MNYVISTNMPTLSRLLLQFIKKKEEKIIRLTLLVMNDKVLLLQRQIYCPAILLPANAQRNTSHWLMDKLRLFWSAIIIQK